MSSLTPLKLELDPQIISFLSIIEQALLLKTAETIISHSLFWDAFLYMLLKWILRSARPLLVKDIQRQKLQIKFEVVVVGWVAAMLPFYWVYLDELDSLTVLPRTRFPIPEGQRSIFGHIHMDILAVSVLFILIRFPIFVQLMSEQKVLLAYYLFGLFGHLQSGEIIKVVTLHCLCIQNLCTG